ncbi:DNA adenine methylase [Planctomycetota bacterium]
MAAIKGIPQPFPYQGSKRMLASQIVGSIPSGMKCLVEPFAGSAAISLAAAYLGKADRYLINDRHKPLYKLWKAILKEPDHLTAQYRRLWTEQIGKERKYYDYIREEFNQTHGPHHFLYLLARCIKAAIRYNRKGEFNNSPDNRRKGMHPDKMEQNIRLASEILKGKTKISCRDYREILGNVTHHDLVYMDPPYQGVCDTRDHRYCHSVYFNEFVTALESLNKKKIPYLVSYDGRTGQKVYGEPLPDDLGLEKVEIHVGRSTQATLLGRVHHTYESLYLSPALIKRLGEIPKCLIKQPEKLLFA